jgi:ABC-2 type transport system permease protein
VSTTASPSPAALERPVLLQGASGSWLRIRAIARRHRYVLQRSPHRFFDVFIWPVVDVLLWGSLGVFVSQQTGEAQQAGVTYLLAGILLFHVVYQSQISVSTGFLEEIWSRNLLNLMTTPIKEWEYAAGVGLFGLAKVAVGLAVVLTTSVVLYSFDLFEGGWGLLPIGMVLLVAGWAIAFFVIGLVLRFGQSAEVLAWGIMFVVMPLSGIFYPVDALPTVLQPIAYLLPTTHAFAASRALLDGDPLPWDELAYAAVGSLALGVLGIWFVTRMLKTFRLRGYVTRHS